MSEVKAFTVWILLMIAFGMMFHSMAATDFQGDNTVYVTVEGEFEDICIYRRGDSNDYLQLRLTLGDEEGYFISDMNHPSVYKVFITINGTTSPSLEVNVIWQVDRILEYEEVVITFRFDYEPYGTVTSGELMIVVLAALVCSVLALFGLVIVWESTCGWRYDKKKEYGYEMRIPYATAKRKRTMPIEGHWWIKMIKVRLGMEEKAVFE